MESILFLFQRFSEEYIKQYQLMQFVYTVAWFLSSVCCLLILRKRLKVIYTLSRVEPYRSSRQEEVIIISYIVFSTTCFWLLLSLYNFVVCFSNMLSPLPAILHF